MLATGDITIALSENPAILGTLANDAAIQLGILNFQQFKHQRATPPFLPLRPIEAIYGGPIEEKQLVFDAVNREKKIAHHKALINYEKSKRTNDILNLYAPDLDGYGAYLMENHPHVMDFFGQRRTFPINEGSRRLHTYITGGSGSGKSELLKSLIWHYLSVDSSSAMVFIDPHSDVAQQVAKFRPNRDNARLVYIKPKFDDLIYPGLNPFDISNKDSISDAEAELYADEFIRAFREILRGDLSDQMDTLLKNTIPVLIKMPGTSVYDLIKFLRPKDKPTKGQEMPNQEEYQAPKYIEFAKANFQNQAMLGFLSGQFESDSGYVITRNSLTTRLMGVFGGTRMQGLFLGKRTVRFEDLIPQRKLIVFNLAELGRDTETVGRFILITMKIFAINQSNIPRNKRTPCHVFVDECQKFVTDSMQDILEEARKYFVYLTLAQQTPGAKMSTDLFKAVLTNTATKIAGVNSNESAGIMCKEIGVPAETITGFAAGQFAIFQREATPKLAVVRMPTNTLNDRASMTAAEWKILLGEQTKAYYREPNGPDANSTGTREESETNGSSVPYESGLVPSNPFNVNIDALLN